MGEILLWKTGTEMRTIAAFLAIEMSLNEIDEVSFTVRIVSKLPQKPSAACPTKTSGCSAISAKPSARSPGSSSTATPSSSAADANGLKHSSPSSGPSLMPCSSSCISTSFDASVNCDAVIASTPDQTNLTSPLAATTVPAAMTSTEPTMDHVGVSSRARNMSTSTISGVDALSICRKETDRST